MQMKRRRAPAGLILTAAVALLLTGCSERDLDSRTAAARQAVENKAYAEAIVELKSVLNDYPQANAARILLGKAFLADTQPLAAATELKKALSGQHQAEDVLPDLARAMLALGQYAEVTTQFAADELRGEPQADLMTSIAAAYAAQNQPGSATAALDAALQAKPDHTPARVLEARFLAADGKVDDAFGRLRKVLDSHPQDSLAWRTQGDLLLYARHNPAAALDAYQRAIAAEPRNVEAHAGAMALLLAGADLAAATKQFDAMRAALPKHPQTRAVEARLAFQRRDYARAEALLQTVLPIAPNDANVLQLAGATALNTGALAQAEKYLQQALSVGDARQPTTRQLLALALARGGRLDKALDALQPLLERQPDSRTLSLAAELQVHRGDLAKADALFAAAARQSPEDTRSRTALALSAMRRGKPDLGAEQLASLAAGDSHSTTADLALIATALARRQFDQAFQAIDVWARKEPNKAQVELLRGRAHVVAGDLKAARRDFEQALHVEPQAFAAVTSLAALDIRERLLPQAQRRIEQWLDSHPADGEALRALVEVRRQAGASTQTLTELLQRAVRAAPSDAASRSALVRHLMAAQQLPEAAAAAQDGVAALPKDATLAALLAQTQIQLGDCAQALRSLTLLQALQPRAPELATGRATCHLRGHNFDAARTALKQALDQQPDLLPVQQMLVQVELAASRPAEALAVASLVRKQRPQQAVGWVLEGDIELARSNAAAAVSAYRAGMAKQAQPALAQRLYSALVSAGKPAEATRFADGWITSHPRDLLLNATLADEAMRRGDTDSAEARYQAMLKLAPDDVLVLNNLAQALLRGGKPGALPLAEKANQLRPQRPELMDTLAAALAAEGRLGAAIELQRKAVLMQPKRVDLRLALAELQIRDGQADAATSTLEPLLAGKAQDPGRAEAERLIKSIKRG